MAYDSVEEVLYRWFMDHDLYPGQLGVGDVQDLAEKVSGMMRPYRDFYRAHAGHDGYDIKKTFEEAKKHEDSL